MAILYNTTCFSYINPTMRYHAHAMISPYAIISQWWCSYLGHMPLGMMDHHLVMAEIAMENHHF